MDPAAAQDHLTGTALDHQPLHPLGVGAGDHDLAFGLPGPALLLRECGVRTQDQLLDPVPEPGPRQRPHQMGAPGVDPAGRLQRQARSTTAAGHPGGLPALRTARRGVDPLGFVTRRGVQHPGPQQRMPVRQVQHIGQQPLRGLRRQRQVDTELVDRELRHLRRAVPTNSLGLLGARQNLPRGVVRQRQSVGVVQHRPLDDPDQPPALLSTHPGRRADQELGAANRVELLDRCRRHAHHQTRHRRHNRQTGKTKHTPPGDSRQGKSRAGSPWTVREPITPGLAKPRRPATHPRPAAGSPPAGAPSPEAGPRPASRHGLRPRRGQAGR